MGEVVYVAMTGENEDHGVEAIFSTREKAEEFLAGLAKAHEADPWNNYPPAGVEVWTIDETGPGKVTR